MKGVAIVSGGMDSVTLVHYLRDRSPDVELHLLGFNYGQRHGKELMFARECAQDVGATFDVVDLVELKSLLAQSGSSLVNDMVDVPHGHYEAETMKATVVPNRNAIMLSIATGIAVAEKAIFVAAGMHAGDHAIYPDCRPEFVSHLEEALRTGNEGFIVEGFRLETPWIYKTKAEICAIGNRLGVDWTRTWSCYEGGDIHCGQCGTCVERREAFELAGVTDPTEYANGS